MSETLSLRIGRVTRVGGDKLSSGRGTGGCSKYIFLINRQYYNVFLLHFIDSVGLSLQGGGRGYNR